MIKHFLFLLLSFTTALNVTAQTPYTSTPDEKHPEVTVLNGIVTKYALSNNPSFNWYNTGYSTYEPPVEVMNAMEAAKDKVQFVVFGGTWCEDTQFILPRFFKLQERSGFPDNSISFFSVNRAKQTIGNITAAFKIINVPTIIVMKDGLEVGRVVEYGKTGKWDSELASFLK